MASRLASLGLALTPAVALGVAAVALRLGSTPPIVAATVFGAPPASDGSRIVWQVFTGVEDGDTQQGTAVPALVVTAASGGREATWRGATDAYGVAYATLGLALHAGDPVALTVRSAARGTLASGEATWGPPQPTGEAQAVPFRGWGAREGDIALDVAVDGRALGTAEPGIVWVRATDALTHAALAGASLDASPVLALDLRTRHAVTDRGGWAKIEAKPLASGAGVKLSARDPLGRSGEWSGLLPVDPNVMTVAVEPVVAPASAFTVRVYADGVPAVYAEVHDRMGTVAAAALDVAHGHSSFEVPSLAEGLHWVVAFTDPRGASSAPTLRPFFVAKDEAAALAMGPGAPACGEGGEVGPCLACTAVPASSRWVALDGFVPRRAADAATHRRARRIAFAALLSGGAVESVFIVLAFLAARRRLRDAESATPEIAHARGRNAALFLAAGLAVSLLGFGLMAAMVMR